MNTSVERYKNSLLFSTFDLRIIARGVFNRSQFFVCKIIGRHKCSPTVSDPALLEMIPLYTIAREDGVFVKKHLQNYNNVHCLIVPCVMCKEIEKESLRNAENGHTLVGFVKTLLHRNTLVRNGQSYSSAIMFPGDTIAFSCSAEQLYYRNPVNRFASSRVSIPLPIMQRLRCNRAFNLSEHDWRTVNLLGNNPRKQACTDDNLTVPTSKVIQTSADTSTNLTANRDTLSTEAENSKKCCIDIDVKPSTSSAVPESVESSEFVKDCKMTDEKEEESMEIFIERFNRKRPYETRPRALNSTDTPVIHDELLGPWLRARAHGREIVISVDENVRRNDGSPKLQEDSRLVYDREFLKRFHRKCR